MTTTISGQPLGGFVDTVKGFLFRNLGKAILTITCLEFTNNSSANVILNVYQTEGDKSYQICNLTLLPGWSKVFKEERFVNAGSGFEAVCSSADVVSWRVNFK